MPKPVNPKLKTRYVCSNCASIQTRWAGKCPDCGEWNTLNEEVVDLRAYESGKSGPSAMTNAPQKLSNIRADDIKRIPLSISEFSRVLGGGIVPGSLVLVGGDPGIGKSTLLMQSAVITAKQQGTTLYVSGEESAQQLKMRADRLGVGDSDLYLLTETNMDAVIHHIEQMKPKLAIIDSIQTMYVDTLGSSAGTVSQVRECAQRLQQMAKTQGIACFIVGHVTKEGTIAGPKVLEHIVDTVLQLEGDRFHAFRLLRSIKNRFGATSEVGVFEMSGSGMSEVLNPSEVFLAERMMNAPGSAIAVTMEGTRPLLVEVQALTSVTQNPMPRRTANGFDHNRLFLLLAVLAKRVGIRLHDQDVFVNVVGGLTIDEPAADLAAAIAIASAAKGAIVPADMAIIGEIGLSGELRQVSQLNQRINEAKKLGFDRCLVPKTSRPIENVPANLKLIPARSVGEALDAALGTHSK
jgi:DNA repair protein RadA/Sms